MGGSKYGHQFLWNKTEIPHRDKKWVYFSLTQTHIDTGRISNRLTTWLQS